VPAGFGVDFGGDFVVAGRLDLVVLVLVLGCGVDERVEVLGGTVTVVVMTAGLGLDVGSVGASELGDGCTTVMPGLLLVLAGPGELWVLTLDDADPSLLEDP